jgi:NAD(P)-dependent dehydrogenase (short-subunit alcohol dehydrogenase family)
VLFVKGMPGGEAIKSVFLTCKAIAPDFIERMAGRIINIASMAGQQRHSPCRPTPWRRRASFDGPEGGGLPGSP